MSIFRLVQHVPCTFAVEVRVRMSLQILSTCCGLDPYISFSAATHKQSACKGGRDFFFFSSMVRMR